MIDNIKFVIFDFDGVFTDGKCYFDVSGNIKKYYNIKDGMALKILKDNNIKTGLISSYSTNNDIYINEDEVKNHIINHLKFDYKHIGTGKKLDILDMWLLGLDYTYENVAYIGDDINDVCIMEKVKFSACPNDAVQECKNIVNYVCKSNGGNGCIREFVETIVSTNQKYDNMKNEINYMLNNYDLNEINCLSKSLVQNNGNVYFCGVGKSGTMANHCCDLLKSLSIKCFTLNPLNALHGDIGTINNNDMILMFSKSGNTIELLNLIPNLKSRQCKIIGICCDNNSKFEHQCDKTIILPLNNEMQNDIDKIPTNSCVSMLLFTNILVSYMSDNISINKYKLNHPAGSIGYEIMTIKDKMIFDYPKILLNISVDLYDILLEMTNKSIGCCFFVDTSDNLLGIMTDGDVRRLLLNTNSKQITLDNINKNYYYETDVNKFISKLKHNIVPIIYNKKLIGVVIK